MNFLDGLRKQNIFNQDKPFGMPDTDSGNLGEMIRQMGPLASSLKDDDLRRRKELMQFEHSLRNRGRGPMQQPQGVGGMRGGPRQVIGPGAMGPSTMQQRFARDEERGQQEEFKREQSGLDRSSRLEETMAEGKMRSEADMARLTAELNARREIGGADRESRERVSQNELAARIRESQTARDARSAETQAEIASRERIAGMPARTNPNQSPSQQGNQFENRVQQLAIENPAAFALLTKDANGQFTFKPGSDPKQMDWVRNYITGAAKPGQTMKPEPVHGKTITQRNKRTGETRQVPVK